MAQELWGSGEYSDRFKYEEKFNEVYLSSTIYDMRNKRIVFRAVNGERDWSHVCFGKSGMQSLSEALWDKDRAQRILWIKDALQNGQRTTIHFERGAENIKLYYYCTSDGNERHQGCGHLKVVVEEVDDKTLNFITASSLHMVLLPRNTNKKPQDYHENGNRKQGRNLEVKIKANPLDWL